MPPVSLPYYARPEIIPSSSQLKRKLKAGGITIDNFMEIIIE
jgi:hypothetical protein